MKLKFAKLISVITVVPIIAFLITSWFYFYNKNYFGTNSSWYYISLFFLTLFPLSAYLLKNFIPSIKKQGRSGERKLAFIMAVLGYILGTFFSVIFKAPKLVKCLFLTYLVSGSVLLFFNKVLKIKASGHGCGISGPITLIVFFIGGYSWSTILLLPLVFWSRLKLGRHTYRELCIGTLVGFFSTLAVLFVYKNSV